MRAIIAAVALLSSGLVWAADDVMEGFPPSAETQVTLKNWATPPFSRWGFRNVGIAPSVMVPRAGGVQSLPYDLDSSIAKTTFEYQGKNYSFPEVLAADNTDGYLVIKDGKILYEEYFRGFGEHDHHLWASSTKSLVSIAAGILVDQKKLDVTKLVPEYLPELKQGAFADLTVQQVLDMVSAINYSEDYENLTPGSVHFEYFRRIGLTPSFDLMQIDPLKDSTPRGIQSFLPQFERNKDLEPNTVFEYHSPNVDVIGWIIERQSGMALQTFISQHIWSKLQAEHDAFMITDIDYTAVATGGFNSTLRDFARFGLLVLNDGKINNSQIVSADWISNSFKVTDENIQHTTRSVYKEEGGKAYDDQLIAYKNFWWVHDRDKGIFTARGVFGQTLYINKEKNVVIAFFSSAPSASNAMRDTYKVKLYATQVIADNL